MINKAVCVYIVFSLGRCECFRGMCEPKVCLYCITDEKWQSIIVITHNAHKYNTSLLLLHIMSSLCHITFHHLLSSHISLIISYHLITFLYFTPSTPQTLPVYLEFIQHHLLMGASHIFISAPYAWGGKLMTSLQRILRSFIADGSLTLHSQADNGEDHLYGILGLSLDKDFMRLLQVSDLSM
jgi:hypothetical protein